jgi:outer membrane lipoprotein SlyB
MPNLIISLFSLLFVILLASCASSSDVDRQAKNQFITEFYAWVENVEEVKFKSYVGQGAAIGATDGFLSSLHGNRNDMLGGAIIGGLIGGLFTALFEGNNRGYEYKLAAVDGDVVSVIVDKKKAMEGECVRVRVAGDVRLSLQPSDICQQAAEEYSY